MIDTIGQGAIGTAGPGDGSGRMVGTDPSTPAAVVDALALLRPDADAHRRGAGAAPVNGLLAELAEAVGGCSATDQEFAAALVVELARRYLLAVRAHGRGTAVPRVWQVVLEAWAGRTVHEDRIALAGAHAIVGHDLPPAVVSTCTLLGRTPGPAERGDLRAVAVLLAGLARETARRASDAAILEDASGLELLLTRGECWRQAEHLWTVRGRPSEAERERQALDLRAALIVRGVLANAGT